ncbi:MAG TPA: alpha/beta-type small acid-soluble spore protein [Clostridia bacterium]|nr:alpha/beta-type small acid-soluble spore protein [Clostridia bacterium]
MANNSSTLATNNQMKQLLQNLKTEVASSLNVNLQQGYNGDITARQAGSIGGEMVKRMIAYAQNNMGGTSGNIMK